MGPRTTENIAPGIHRLNLPLPFELKQINTYLVQLADGWLMVDAGINSADCLESVSRLLGALSIEWRQVRKLLLTHFHPDHMGLAPKVLELSHAELLMHEHDVDQLRDVVAKVHRSAWIKQLYVEAGIPVELQEKIRSSAEAIDKNFIALEPRHVLKGGESIETTLGPLEVVWTPGHSPGHICLFLRGRRILFSGDHMLETITPNISWYPDRDTLGEFLESLDAIRQLDVDLILPSHGQPFRGHIAWIEQTKQHHEERCQAIIEALAGGSKTAFELVGLLWPKVLSPFNVRFALFEVLAHLEHMRRRGSVKQEPSGPIVRWAAA